MAREIEIRGTAHGKARRFLEAARSLNPRWLQAHESGKLTVQFSQHSDIDEGGLFMLADTFGYELESKRITNSPWVRYYFE